MERTEIVAALGRSLLDYLPQARQPSSTLGTTPGLAPSREKPCETCGARGRLTPKGAPCAACAPLRGVNSGRPHFGVTHGCRPCLVCDGWGWIRTRADSGYDSMTRSELGGDDPTPEARGDLERRLQRTERLILEWERPEAVAFAWEERQRSQWRQGDYGALTRALEALQRIAPRRHSLWWRAVVLDEPLTLSPLMQRELDTTTALLAELMPDRPLRLPKHLQASRLNAARKTSLWRGQTTIHDRLRLERDQTIHLQRFQLGWSTVRIASYHALTRQHVNRILRASAA